MEKNFMEKATEDKQNLTALLFRISSRENDGTCYLGLDEAYVLQDLKCNEELGKYLVQGILTENKIVGYNRDDETFYNLNSEKLKDSIETISKLNDLVMNSPKWQRAHNYKPRVDSHYESAMTINDKILELERKERYQKSSIIFETEKNTFERDILKISLERAETKQIDDKYLAKMTAELIPLMIKEEMKYSNVNLFGNYI